MNSLVLEELFEVIKTRKTNKIEGSYTCYLFEKGLDKILKKVGEESAETIIAAKNGDSKDVIMETADLMYHLLVMLADLNIPIENLFEELSERARKQKNLKVMKEVNLNS